MPDIESNSLKDAPIIERIASLDSRKAYVSEQNADATLKFMEEHSPNVTTELTPEIEARIRRKLYIWLIPLIMTINCVLFIDKSVLSYGVLLGLYRSTHINSTQYNNLNSIFYAGYFFGQFPMHYLLQKYNFGKLVALTLFSWSILIFTTAAASSYGGLIILRLLLGFVESAILPAIEITLLQFFSPRERSMINPFFWISSNAPTVWIGGFISYGLLHMDNPPIPPWRIFMIIIGGLTLVNSIWAWFLYPSNPTDAKFLTIEEKVLLIEKIQKASSTSIEQKTIKTYQIIECLKDPITWLFTAFGFFSMIHNNLMFQINILYQSLGIKNLIITLINVVAGGFNAVFVIFGIFLLYKLKGHSDWVVAYSAIPGIVGCFGMLFIPYERKLALVAMLILTSNTFGLAFIILVGWSTSSAGGYTKKFYRNILFMAGYSIANVISPQIWRGHQEPRYYIAWSIQLVVSFILPLGITFLIHFILKRRNTERLKYIEEHPDERFGQITKTDEDTGVQIVEQVDIANLDLTDLENKFFIYPL